MEATPSVARHRIRRRAGALVVAIAASSLAIIAPGGTAHAVNLPLRPVLVSRDAAGQVATEDAGFADMSGDGRYVVFVTDAAMVAGDGNNEPDVYVKDRWAGTVERISVNSAEVGANDGSSFPSISDDGRRVAFGSQATNLGGAEVLGQNDIFVRDRIAGTTTRVSVSTNGGELSMGSGQADISGNGRFVAFNSKAPAIVAGDTNNQYDVFVRDLQTNTSERVSVTSAEVEAIDGSDSPSISDDGRYVAFTSDEELAGGRPGAGRDVFVRDRTAGTTVNANLSTSTVVGDADAWPPVLSGNGRYVAFYTAATNFGTDTNSVGDAYRRDLVDGVTIRVSVHDNESQLPLGGYPRAISDDGSQVVFNSNSPATGAADAGGDQDVFVRNVSAGSTRRVTTSPTALDVSATQPIGEGMSDDGASVLFSFRSSNGLVPDHTNGREQLYVSESMSIGPLPTLTAFINQQYLDFAGRSATSGERELWQAWLQSGRATPSSMIASLASADAFAKNRGPVVRLYWAFFLRKPDPGGLTFWINRFKSGTKLSAIAQQFATSSEFENRYGTKTNEQFVKLIYPNIFERQPDPSGLAYWTGKLDSKALTRGDVMVGFSESSEGQRRLAPQVYITLISQGMLGVSPSSTFWDDAFAGYKVDGEKELAWLAHVVLGSSMYANRIT